MTKVNLANVKGRIAYALDAAPLEVSVVLSADPDTDDGRSQWMWVWFDDEHGESNLILACFPQGDTYCETEGDHS